MAERSPIPGAYIPPENRNPFLKFVENNANVVKLASVSGLISVFDVASSTSPEYVQRFSQGFYLAIVSLALAGVFGLINEKK